jgi:hypothetical protein
MEQFLGSPASAPAIGAVGMFICIAVISVGCTVAVQWRKVRQATLEAELKRDMIQQGMSADDIVKVLTATAFSEPGQPSQPTEPASRASGG